MRATFEARIAPTEGVPVSAPTSSIMVVTSTARTHRSTTILTERSCTVVENTKDGNSDPESEMSLSDGETGESRIVPE